MRLGAVYAERSANAAYRVVMPMMALQQRGHEVVGVVQQRGRRLPIEQLVGCDLVQMHRLILEDDEDDTVQRLRRAGVLVSFDDDDDSSEAPDELEGIVEDGTLEIARRDFGRLLARAPEVDLVTTPSDLIADRFEAAGAVNVQVIDNHLLGEWGRVRPRGHTGTVIGWHACAEHRLDADLLGIAAPLQRVLDAHPNVRVVTIGVDLGIEHERYVCEENVPFDQLTQRLADFDVGIAPLADIPFSCARSNVKVREFAAAGVPWLASDTPPYQGLGHSEGGRLVADDEWFEALDELLRAPRERSKLARQARSWAARETIEAMAEVWEETFLETIDLAHAPA